MMQHDGGEYLKRWRALLGVSQPIAARAIGVSLRTVAAWEGAERPMPVVAYKALPEARRRVLASRVEKASRKRRAMRQAYAERQAEQRAERARIRAGAKGPAWW